MERFENNSEKRAAIWEGKESILRNEEEVVLSVSPSELQKAFLLISKYLEKKDTLTVIEQEEISKKIKALIEEVKAKYSMSNTELKTVFLYNLLEGISVDDDSVSCVDLPDGEFEQFIKSFLN